MNLPWNMAGKYGIEPHQPALETGSPLEHFPMSAFSDILKCAFLIYIRVTSRPITAMNVRIQRFVRIKKSCSGIRLPCHRWIVMTSQAARSHCLRAHWHVMLVWPHVEAVTCYWFAIWRQDGGTCVAFRPSPPLHPQMILPCSLADGVKTSSPCLVVTLNIICFGSSCSWLPSAN